MNNYISNVQLQYVGILVHCNRISITDLKCFSAIITKGEIQENVSSVCNLVGEQKIHEIQFSLVSRVRIEWNSIPSAPIARWNANETERGPKYGRVLQVHPTNFRSNGLNLVRLPSICDPRRAQTVFITIATKLRNSVAQYDPTCIENLCRFLLFSE